MFVIDWSQIGEGCRLDVRWIYNRGLNPDQLPLLLRPLSFLLLFSAQMRTIQVGKKGQNSRATHLLVSRVNWGRGTMPTGCLPSVSSNGGGWGGVGGSHFNVHRSLSWAVREQEISPLACRSRRPTPFQVVLGCREVGGASAAAPWHRRRCGETRPSQ